MNEYFAIEKEEVKDQKEIKNQDEITENIRKYYSIYIEGLPYGTLIRETEDYPEALRLYRKIKKDFNIFNCNVVLQKHILIDNEEKDVSVIYRKEIGADYMVKKHLTDIEDILDQLDQMKRLYTNTHSECDKYISAFQHSLEKINAERLTEDQMRNIFRSVEEKGALRRISKTQTDLLMSLSQNINSIRSNVEKALATYKKIEYNKNTQKAIENKTAKDREYLTTIGLSL